MNKYMFLIKTFIKLYIRWFKQIIKNKDANINPIGVFILVIAIAGVFALFLGQILEPFFQIMSDSVMRNFLLFLFPNGLLLFVLLIAGFSLIQHMQKKNYKEV